jgi:uncharacterized protein with von Willebrand factor type A (vWA) domain
MVEATLPEQVILFSRFLKNRGFRVFSSNVRDALEGLGKIDVGCREDFSATLRANLVSSDGEWNLFEDLFEEFWQEIFSEEEAPSCEKSMAEDQDSDAPQQLIKDFSREQDGRECSPGTETFEGVTYSPLATLEKKDLASFETSDIPVARLILKSIIAPFRMTKTYRYRKSRNPGKMDFRRTLRKSLKAEGVPLELFYRQKKRRLKRLVILTDVSGSMDRYARFVMPFLLGLKGVGSRAEVFVFSTALTRITHIVKRFTVERALEIIAQEVSDWSGGTRIGYSFHQFNQAHGERLLNNRTVVVIMSDGWDLGGRDLLVREMEDLHRRAHCVMWLNPLAGGDDYWPTCRGMQAALPYVDYFLPADTLQSLKRAGRILSRLMVH